jgi:guanine deaminase
MLALRAPMLTFTGDPFAEGLAATVRHEPDAVVAMANGLVVHAGPAAAVLPQLPEGTLVEHFGRGYLMVPGFLDLHAHYPQATTIASHGEQLLGWLERHVFPAERRLEDPAHARHVADVFLRECLRAGTTTVAAYCSVHAHSVDAFFEAAERHRMRVIAGKVMMDRHAPAWLLDTPERGHDESKALLDRWHGRGRALYAVTPRFVGTSSPAQLEAAAALWRAHDGTWLQTHLAENRDEVAWVAELFPGCRDYVEVLERHGLTGPRALLGHGIWLDDDAAARLRASGAALVHCPTSNAFLGSGLFRLRDLRGRHGVPTALGTDIGAGTSFSLLQVMGEAYKAAQLGGATLDPLQALYLATRGAAEAAGLGHRVGSLAPGLEADVVVLDLRSTPLIDFRMDYCESLADELFVQMTLGDDRAVRATYVAGRCAHRRP